MLGSAVVGVEDGLVRDVVDPRREVHRGAEVDEAEAALLLVQHHVEGLDVPVDDPRRVEALEAAEDLLHRGRDRALGGHAEVLGHQLHSGAVPEVEGEGPASAELPDEPEALVGGGVQAGSRTKMRDPVQRRSLLQQTII